MLVEFFEGAISSNQLVEAVEMQFPPCLGEFVAFTALGKAGRFEIISLEHILETRMTDHGPYESPETSVSLIRCGLMQR